MIPLLLATSNQGKKVAVYGFAIDLLGHTGYSLSSGITSPNSVESLAFSDTSLIVYGHTFKSPHSGVVADLAVDTKRGNVFMSNLGANLLDIWQNSTQSFDSLGIAVGSQPWGLAVGNNPDTLLVANSGSTTLSRVFINAATPRGMAEDLPNRILTRASYVFLVTESRNVTTGATTISAQGPILFSDRPQYLAQSKGGRIFNSTEPTLTAPTGTVRWIDPTLPVPDPQNVWEYGSIQSGQQIVYALFNVDSIFIGIANPSSNVSDTLFIFDHPYGQLNGVIAVSDTTTAGAVAKANALGSDAQAVLNLDMSSIGLKDTTFVAASGDRTWIGFVEGNTTGAGRVIMVNDPVAASPTFFSPVVSVTDLTNNASEHVNGLAIDSTGQLIGAHGALNTYLSFVSNPFHLRLGGSYADSSVASGGGVAMHPSLNGLSTPAASRIGFTAFSPTEIDIFDAAHFLNRGKLLLKNPLTGPIRVSAPFPGDPASVVLKLFAMTSAGLVVINLTATDIKPGS